MEKTKNELNIEYLAANFLNNKDKALVRLFVLEYGCSGKEALELIEEFNNYLEDFILTDVYRKLISLRDYTRTVKRVINDLEYGRYKEKSITSLPLIFVKRILVLDGYSKIEDNDYA